MGIIRKRLEARLQWWEFQKVALRNFGLKLWIVKKLATKVYPRNRKLGIWLNERKHEIILQYIHKHYGSLISLPEQPGLTNITDDCPIWTCWWTGEDNAPELVKACFRSIRKYAGNHEVIVISWDNYQEYVDIPDTIIRKCREEKKILPAHVADLLRCKLMEKYGGIWCDATIFMTADHDKMMYDYPFFTIKHHLEYAQGLELEPSKCYWRIFYMASAKENPLLKITGDILEQWMLSDTPLINYWTMDYIFLLIYRKNKWIKEMMDNLPYNNEHPYFMQNHINDVPTDEILDILSTQGIHKLSWKESVKDTEDNVYQRMINAK